MDNSAAHTFRFGSSDEEDFSGDSKQTTMSILGIRTVVTTLNPHPHPSRSTAPTGLLTVPAEIILEIARFLSASDLIRLGATCKRFLPFCMGLAYQMVAEGPARSIDRSLSHAMAINSTGLFVRVRQAVMRRGVPFQVNRPISSTVTASTRRDAEPEPMLMTAVASRNNELTELLLAHGAEVDISHRGQTPLVEALAAAERRQGHICPRNMVQLLVRHGASVTAPAEILMRLGHCYVHEDNSECLTAMGEMFLLQPEVSSNPGLQERLVAWMGGISRGPMFSPRMN